MTELIPLVEQIDAILPQTQCTKCGYQGCRPYAEAMAAGDNINKCPPGGQAGIRQLAALLHRPEIPLDSSHGEESEELKVAFIREAECIGCTKCIQACPVDAIIGAAKLMHTVISDICTGCDLCVAPCPVDCIDMVPARDQHPTPEVIQTKAVLSRQRFQQRNQRLARLSAAKDQRRQARIDWHEKTAGISKQVAVEAALQAVHEKTAARSNEEQQQQLQRALAAARERLERAEAKVREAEKKGSSQLDQLRARREDMRFKLQETEKKLAQLRSGASTAHDAVARILAARSRKSDSERLDNGIQTIEHKLAVARQQLASANGEELLLLQQDIERLQGKYLQLQQELSALLQDAPPKN